jgi:hypothetical protein
MYFVREASRGSNAGSPVYANEHNAITMRSQSEAHDHRHLLLPLSDRMDPWIDLSGVNGNVNRKGNGSCVLGPSTRLRSSARTMEDEANRIESDRTDTRTKTERWILLLHEVDFPHPLLHPGHPLRIPTRQRWCGSCERDDGIRNGEEIEAGRLVDRLIMKRVEVGNIRSDLERRQRVRQPQRTQGLIELPTECQLTQGRWPL